MSIYRIRKDKNNPFVMVNKSILDDERISYKAKGILIYLLSKPDDWVIYESEIAKHAPDGIKSVKSGIKELIKYKYIHRFKKRNEKGQFVGYEYHVFEVPTEMPFSDVGFSDVGKWHPTNNNITNNDKTNIYVNLPIDGHIFLNVYNFYFKKKFGTDHMKVTQENAEYILNCVKILEEDFGITLEEWSEKVESHFISLPESNNGNILAFLKATMRYFEADLQRIYGRNFDLISAGCC